MMMVMIVKHKIIKASEENFLLPQSIFIVGNHKKRKANFDEKNTQSYHKGINYIKEWYKYMHVLAQYTSEGLTAYRGGGISFVQIMCSESLFSGWRYIALISIKMAKVIALL